MRRILAILLENDMEMRNGVHVASGFLEMSSNC